LRDLDVTVVNAQVAARSYFPSPQLSQRLVKRFDTSMRLSVTEFPGQQGFSPQNLKYMRAFAAA